VADDQEQRNFELVKLRIAFLQHITTLSGAAILIMLALIERAETAEAAGLLATGAAFYGLAVLVSVVGIMYLINYVKYEDPIQGSPGWFATLAAASAFAAAVLGTAVTIAGVPTRMLVIISFGFLALSVAALPVASHLGRKRTRASDPSGSSSPGGED
jgi:hypothetical protein